MLLGQSRVPVPRRICTVRRIEGLSACPPRQQDRDPDALRVCEDADGEGRRYHCGRHRSARAAFTVMGEAGR